MKVYKALKRQIIKKDDFCIVPIRYKDRYRIMKWRNQQIYHLRQDKPLTVKIQNSYFTQVINKLYEEEFPSQILFSFLKNESCVGYGGLVHIDWKNKNAEISFVMDTSHEERDFKLYWQNFLYLLEIVAFCELKFHKIFTFAYNLRPHLFTVLVSAGFREEAILSEHCFITDKYIDVLIHSKLDRDFNFYYRMAEIEDAVMLFNWANEKVVRYNSLSSEKIDYDSHQVWLKNKLDSSNTKIFIFFCNCEPLGQLRLDYDNGYWVVDYSVDANFRGKGFGLKLVQSIVDVGLYKPMLALVKKENIASRKVFEKCNFTLKEELIINSEKVHKLIWDGH